MPDPKRPPSSAAKTLFQTAAEMFGDRPFGDGGKSFAEAVKVEPAKPIPIDVKVVVADNDPAQLERLGVRFGPVEGAPTLSRDEAAALGYGAAYDYAASRPPPYVMRVGAPVVTPAEVKTIAVAFGQTDADVRALVDVLGPCGTVEAVAGEIKGCLEQGRSLADLVATRRRVREAVARESAVLNRGPEGPGQWVVTVDAHDASPPAAREPALPESPRRPALGDRVYFTPPPSPEALRPERRLDSFFPLTPYPAPAVLAADVIRVDAEGTVSLFVKCPALGPYAVHRVEQAPEGVEPGTAEAACLWSWPTARLT